MTKLHDLLRAQRGRYLWSVRLADEALLSWQVGEPHLHLEMGRTAEGLDRRHATPRGRWQVAILDGELTLATPLGRLALSGELDRPEGARALLDYLEGQALVTFAIEPARLRLRFDLDTELELGGPHALLRTTGPEGEGEWAPEG